MKPAGKGGFQRKLGVITPEMIVEKMVILSSEIKDWSSMSRRDGSLWYNLAKQFWVDPTKEHRRNLQDLFRRNRRGLRDEFESIVRNANQLKNREMEAEPSGLDVPQREIDDIGREIGSGFQTNPKPETKKIFCQRTNKVYMMEINESSDLDDGDREVILPSVSIRSNLENLVNEISHLDAASTAVAKSSSSTENFVQAPTNPSAVLTDASENNPAETEEICSRVRVDDSNAKGVEKASYDAQNDEEICQVAVIQAPINPWVTRQLRSHIRNVRRPPRKVDKGCQVVHEVLATKAKFPIKSEALKESMQVLFKRDPTKMTPSHEVRPSSYTNRNHGSIVMVHEVIRKKRLKINFSNNSMGRKNKFAIKFNRI